MSEQPIDEVTRYARDVVGKHIIAGHFVRRACRRHLDDLKRGKKRGLVWRPETALHRLEFFPTFLRHSKGEYAGKPFDLSAWQRFILGSVFGWYRADGTRRYRTAYLEIGRKNGKTALLAGVGIFMLVGDQEAGAEVFACATKRDQAKLIFDDAKRMVAASPELKRLVRSYKLNLSVDFTSSKFEPLSSDGHTLDGLNPHCVLIDELHRHRNRALFDVLDTALGSRRQPLLWIITTAGDDSPESVYASENDYAQKVLDGLVEDDSHFAYIATLDKGDRWDDPTKWIKANPNLGVSVKMDDLERQAQKAAKEPAAQVAFKRLRLNIRTSDTAKAFEQNMWERNSRGRFDPDKLEDKRCWGGLDLSSKIDISAFIKLFAPDGDGIMRVAARFWMPANTIEQRSDRDRMPYRRWVDEGWIEATMGDVIDHQEIQQQILADTQKFEISSIAFDPWNATHLAVQLGEHGVQMLEFVQGLRTYTAPTKELGAMLAARKLDHGDNPVLAVMASNLKIQTDKNLNQMPHKQKSIGRIDGMTALIMAIGRYQASLDEPAPGLHIL
jgi:phage terminase large subunit-like protein